MISSTQVDKTDHSKVGRSLFVIPPNLHPENRGSIRDSICPDNGIK